MTAADAAADRQFGVGVSISGDTAVIGARLDDEGGFHSGSAYVFRDVAGSWKQIAKLTAADAAPNDLFGLGVSVSEDTAVIGAFGDDDGGSSSGSAYVFREIAGSWRQIAKLTAADPAAVDQFGWRLSMSGDVAVVGARLHDDSGSASGSAYVFDLPALLDTNSNGLLDECESDCNTNGLPDSIDIQFSLSDDANGNDIPDECESISGGDFDGDGDVDLTDFAAFEDCCAGSGSPPSPVNPAAVGLCVAAFDSDSDGDVDLVDFAAFCFLFSP